MINYFPHVLNIKDNSLKISVDYNIQFENPKEETYHIEPPAQLTRIISESFDSSNFDFYSIYFDAIETKNVSRMTDYKGICGLLSLPVDILSGSCVSPTHKIYFGVCTAHSAMLSPKCNFIICCPKSDCISAQVVFSLIKKLPAESFNSIDTLTKDIYQKNPNLYIVSWDVKDMIELSLQGNVNKIFSQESLSALKNIVIK